MMTQKSRVMFLCTGNSCRSQMAEGILKRLGGDLVEVHSAGLEAHGLNPRAVKVMAEVGIDIAHYQSKTIDPEL
ncbi:MAG: arsenate reductase ArsC, partial [Sphaerochaeta sp.]